MNKVGGTQESSGIKAVSESWGSDNEAGDLAVVVVALVLPCRLEMAGYCCDKYRSISVKKKKERNKKEAGELVWGKKVS